MIYFSTKFPHHITVACCFSICFRIKCLPMTHTPASSASASGGTPPVVDRAALLQNVRSVVIKIGTNALSDGAGHLDTGLIAHLVQQVATLKERNIQVTLVSSGAIGAGIAELGLPGRPKDLPML